MPTGYTASVQDGTITDVKDFAAACARAFGAFMHQREDSQDDCLQYPTAPHEGYYVEALEKTMRESEAWAKKSEEEKYAEWSDYYNEMVRKRIKALAEDKVRRARYESMIAQVQAIDVPEELDNFKGFMLEQLESSIKFDCDDPKDPFTERFYRPDEYAQWCDGKEAGFARDIPYYVDKIDADWERYHGNCDYIDLMAETFGFEVKGRRGWR